MVFKNKNILWIDDEIDGLRSLILFLENKGYIITPVSNGKDAVELVKDGGYDLIFLDEMMPGMDGLQTLEEIRRIDTQIPVVMVTKSEEEELINQAFGNRIHDFLIKPVRPQQLLSICKKYLETDTIIGEKIRKNFVKWYGAAQNEMNEEMSWAKWIKFYQELCSIRHELESIGEAELNESLEEIWKQGNFNFSRFVENNYSRAISDGEQKEVFSHRLLKNFLIPELLKGGNLAFFIVDCMRLEQWQEIAGILNEYFSISTRHYYSILPTATPYSRNSIFSGLLPGDIANYYPHMWENNQLKETSMNKFEPILFETFIKKTNARGLKWDFTHFKLSTQKEGMEALKKIRTSSRLELMIMVFNFVDILTHSRSESMVLQEIAPDEAAFRSLTRSWFMHSGLFEILKLLGEKGYRIIFTTDHGSIMAARGAKVIGDKTTSTNLRYKVGKNIRTEKKYAMDIREPEKFGLPNPYLNCNYLIAKEDYLFLYPNEYYRFQKHFSNSFQHGGISMDEMILPCAILEPR